MKIKLEEIMAFTTGMLDEISDGMYDWVIDDYEVEEDTYLRHYSFSLRIRQFVDENSEICSEYMNWDLQIDEDVKEPIQPESEMGSYFVDWEKIHDFFSPYIWDNIILFLIEQQLAYYQALGVSVLMEEDYQNMSTKVLGMYDDFCNIQETYQDRESYTYGKVIN